MSQPPLPSSAPSPAHQPAPFFHLGHPQADLSFTDPPDAPTPRFGPPLLLVFAILGTALAFFGQYFEELGEQAATPVVPLPWVIPFVLLLAAIAILPFAAKHFWERHYALVSLALGALVTIYYLILGHGEAMARSLGEYLSFIFLLGSLFIVSGGIFLHVRRKATPLTNTLLLLTGAILANIFGTTGAAMILIRPYLRINKNHIRPFHVVFFIFLVANVGGSLTPIGDPPLFLGYLKGVPFWWVLAHCWPMWCVIVGILLAVFYLLDRRAQAQSPRAPHDPSDHGPNFSLYGGANLLLVFLILAGVLLHNPFNYWWQTLRIPRLAHLPFRELVMVAAVVVTLRTTPRRIHVDNIFHFAPIREVALLFVGIFATMVPALNYLSLHVSDPALSRALATPGRYYYATGSLSAVLDNAPTYMAFLEAELGKLPGNQPDREKIAQLVTTENLNLYLVAISLGAVLFGAMTYIGNGPNFMVKSIAEHAGAQCPSFFAYILYFALPILLPALILIWALFLRVP